MMKWQQRMGLIAVSIFLVLSVAAMAAAVLTSMPLDDGYMPRVFLIATMCPSFLTGFGAYIYCLIKEAGVY